MVTLMLRRQEEEGGPEKGTLRGGRRSSKAEDHRNQGRRSCPGASWSSAVGNREMSEKKPLGKRSWWASGAISSDNRN